MRFVSRFVSRIRACVGVRARIGARVGVGWGAMAPVLLGAGACPGFYVYTAYSNRCAIYLLRTPLTSIGMRFTAHDLLLMERGCVYRLRLSAYYYLLRKNGYVYLLCFIYYP